MNQLLQSIITNAEARQAANLPRVAAESAQEYLPWSDAA